MPFRQDPVISGGWLTSALGTLPKGQQALLLENVLVWNREAVACTGLCLSRGSVFCPQRSYKQQGN